MVGTKLSIWKTRKSSQCLLQPTAAGLFRALFLTETKLARKEDGSSPCNCVISPPLSFIGVQVGASKVSISDAISAERTLLACVNSRYGVFRQSVTEARLVDLALPWNLLSTGILSFLTGAE